MIYLKYFENNSEFKFKKTQKDEYTEIIAYFEGQEKIRYGSITYQTLWGDSAWYWFDGLISAEQYGDLFEDEKFVIIENIKVDKECQKSGLGTQLMNKAIDLIQKSGIKLIVLNASPLGFDISLDNLVLFYKKFGFKVFKSQGKNTIMIKRF